MLTDEGVLALTAAVFLSARQMGASYLDWIAGPCGRFWCHVAGVDPTATYQRLWRERWQRHYPKQRVPPTPPAAGTYCPGHREK